MAEGGQSHRALLASLAAVGDGEFGLADAALAVAALGRPQARLDGYFGHLAELAEEVSDAAGAAGDAVTRAHCLGQVIARRHGYRGDDGDDDDLANANLMDVIDRRRGVPAALGILYLDTARRLGWAAEALAFPAHFLVRLGDGEGRRLIVDPAGGCHPVDPAHMRALLKASAGNGAELKPSLYAAVPDREVLVRLQNDVKLRLLRCGHIDRALATVEATLLFAPGHAPLWREAGLMHMRLQNLGAAVAALEQFAARTGSGQARARTLALLAELRGRIH